MSEEENDEDSESELLTGEQKEFVSQKQYECRKSYPLMKVRFCGNLLDAA